MSETLEPALPDHLDEQAERLMHRLCDKELTVATAESCTGGMLAALLTDIEGAGRGFDRGFVTYTKDAKRDLLGLDRDVLERNDAVPKSSPRQWPKAPSNAATPTSRSASPVSPGPPARTARKAWSTWRSHGAAGPCSTGKSISERSAEAPSG
jgi:hypothetical protein